MPRVSRACSPQIKAATGGVRTTGLDRGDISRSGTHDRPAVFIEKLIDMDTSLNSKIIEIIEKALSQELVKDDPLLADFVKVELIDGNFLFIKVFLGLNPQFS